MTEELRQERRRQTELVRAEFRRQSLDFMVAHQQRQATISGLAEGQVAPQAPVPLGSCCGPFASVPFKIL